MTLLAFLFGLLIGSFLNVCIHRWPDESKSVIRPRSHCPKCEAMIGWKDNIPLLSFLLLRGRCRACGEPISRRYPLVEALNGLIWAAVFAKFGLQPETFKTAAFMSMMLVLIFTDYEHMILPDEITIGGVGVGLVLSWFILVPTGLSQIAWLIAGERLSPQVSSLIESVTGYAVFGGMLWVLREVYYRVRGIDGLGLGDVKMAGMMGAFWGVAPTLFILLLGSILGAVCGSLIILIGGKKWSHELPFGSYLGAAAILVIYWRQELFGSYWTLVAGN